MMMTRVVLFAALAIIVAACSEDETSSSEPTALPVSVATLYESSADLYEVNCAICHGEEGALAGTMRLAQSRGDEFSVLLKRGDLSAEYVSYVIRNGLSMMPAFRPSDLDDAQVEALSEYVVSRNASSEE